MPQVSEITTSFGVSKHSYGAAVCVSIPFFCHSAIHFSFQISPSQSSFTTSRKPSLLALFLASVSPFVTKLILMGEETTSSVSQF